MVTTSCMWGVRRHGHRRLQEPLQTPSMDLRPAEAVSEESTHLRSVPSLGSQNPLPQPIWVLIRVGVLGQAPFCSMTGSEGGAPTRLGADVPPPPENAGSFERASLWDEEQPAPSAKVKYGLSRGSPCGSPPARGAVSTSPC